MVERNCIEILVRGIGRDQFEARVAGRLVCVSHNPFFSTARVLRAEGLPPQTVIAMRHENTAHASLESTIGAAAILTVHEGDKPPHFALYRPLPRRGVAQDGSRLVGDYHPVWETERPLAR